MVPQRDASSIAHVAGALVTMTGLQQLTMGNTGVGIAALILGPVIIVQRILRNRKRDRA